MCLTLFFSSTTYIFDSLRKLERRGWVVFADPFVFCSGGFAGAVARAAVLPFDNGGVKGPYQTVYRRIPQWGILFWVYVPLSSKINVDVKNPQEKLVSTFVLAFLAGFIMRLICNPVNRTRDEAVRMNVSFLEAAKRLRSKTYLQFFYTTPPLTANALYFGTLLVCFEGLRRFAERNGASIDHPVAVVVTNGIAGGVAGGMASTICYPFSAHRYLQTVIHDSALCRGLIPTLMKEVPMCAVAFGTFSMLQPLFAGHHTKRVGFGY